MPSRRQEKVCHHQQPPLTKAHGYNKTKVLVLSVNPVTKILQQLPNLSDLFTTEFKVNLIKTNYFKDDTPPFH